ncbi:DMT family transporter [Microvirga subterranea]|uniref:Transporter family-2 protein n=1 Tax=Microvirga subterranea TaxID=186651 RepID=A0A370HGX1_9HYPH|nr:DMT family transporter [Microvirga subterranea]RDI56799.1 transporter family-2 protein [Microvirga subterranea]
MMDGSIAKIPLILVCVVLGIFLTWQGPVNAEAARRLGSPALAAVLSIGMSVILVVIFALFTVKDKPDWSHAATAPWWTWIGGITGAVFVVGSLLVVPKTGSVLFLLSVILGQMIGAVTADGFGLWGLRETSISPMKILAMLLVLAGAVTFHLGE